MEDLELPPSPMYFPDYAKNEKYQIRIHKTFEEIDNQFAKYKYESSKSFGFQHEADEEVERTHCHLYFFGLKKHRTTVDQFMRERFKGNSEFSVSQTCGKNKRELDIVGAWIYGTTEKLIEPKFTHGLIEEEILYLQYKAEEFWTSYRKAQEAKKKTFEIMEIVIEKEKKDNVFANYLEKVWTNPECLHWTQSDFKRWIIADYLRQCKPAPRVMDLNRYAYSLFMLRDKNKTEFTRHEIHLDQYEMR